MKMKRSKRFEKKILNETPRRSVAEDDEKKTKRANERAKTFQKNKRKLLVFHMCVCVCVGLGNVYLVDRYSNMR